GVLRDSTLRAGDRRAVPGDRLAGTGVRAGGAAPGPARHLAHPRHAGGPGRHPVVLPDLPARTATGDRPSGPPPLRHPPRPRRTGPVPAELPHGRLPHTHAPPAGVGRRRLSSLSRAARCPAEPRTRTTTMIHIPLPGRHAVAGP